ncbi:hypothetical protein AMJ49_01690 [Parcubacteria bacterium DG_74_2]|nr:MAG: hypothetical protein AMJ49_01690 [Parcubacteria bacterium DG_74_2]
MKKIFDVLPPEKLKEKEVIYLPKKKRLKKGWILFFLILALAIFFLKEFPSATIEIWPKTEISKFETDLLVDRQIENPNLFKKSIPGQNFELEKTISREFSSSGRKLKEERATGNIKVFNETTYSQVLVATTRFVSKEGKLFRSTERITVPAGYYEGTKFLPGEIDVEVRAAESGEDYNIGPSTFSIPGLAPSPSYTKIYGRSSQAMSGGSKKEVLVVTNEDLNNAKDFLTDRAKEEGEKFLKENTPIGFLLLEDISKTEVLDISFSAKAGEELEKFNCQIKIKAKNLIFLKKDFEDLIKNYILSKIPGKKIQPESLKTNYSVENFDIDSGKVFLLVDTEVKIYPELDEVFLKKEISQKQIEEVKIFLKNQPEIDKFEINIFPFWAKVLPANFESIRLEIKLD